MLLISCSLFLPLVCLPNILPSSMSLNSTSWRRNDQAIKTLWCPFLNLMCHATGSQRSWFRRWREEEPGVADLELWLLQAHSAHVEDELNLKVNDIALHDKSSQSYEASLAVWDHSVTCHPTQVNSPHVTPARQAGTWFTYSGGMEDWVDPGDWLHTVYLCLVFISFVMITAQSSFICV